jgi:hypothetical protein
MRATVRAAAAAVWLRPGNSWAKAWPPVATGHPTGFERGVGHRRNHRPALYELYWATGACVHLCNAASVVQLAWHWFTRRPVACRDLRRQHQQPADDVDVATSTASRPEPAAAPATDATRCGTGLADSTIDVLVSDHPRTPAPKRYFC